MDDARMIQLQQIRERVAREAYQVDADAVATAILERLREGRAPVVTAERRA